MAEPNPKGPDRWLIVLLALGALLIFWDLGGRDLWEDEAHTALLARGILARGLPYAYDGLNWVTAEAGRDLDPRHLWRWSPWLQFYAAAGALKLLGPGNWACRLPFALAGLLCVPLAYLLALRLWASRQAARWSAAVLLTSVPFLLHARQARWYALAYVFVSGMLCALPGLARGEKKAAAQWALCAALLFYTNHLVAMGVVAAFAIAAWAVVPGRAFWKGFAWALATAFLLALPGAVYHGVLPQKAGAPLGYLRQLIFYAGAFVTFVLPLPMLLLAGREAWRPGAGEAGRWARFLLIFCASFILVLSAGSWGMFRYLSVLLPVAAVLCGLALSALWERRNLAAGAVFLLLAGTDVLHSIPLQQLKAPGTKLADRFPALGPVRFPLAGFLYELSHPLPSCDRPLREYLGARARPGDVVLASYGDFPLQYYTGLKVLGGMQGRPLVPDPDWIVLRSQVISLQPGNDYDVVRYVLGGGVDQSRYERIDLVCPDLVLADSAEPWHHLFRAPPDAKPLELLHRLPPGIR
ncbi:MAG: hypothetical protein NTY77_11050 [Elusimicrobia bacterium]|nr:hypothetical protein [Elusimicrobiota bacterium]